MGLYWQASDNTTKAWGTLLTNTHFDEIKAMLNGLDATKVAGNSGTICTSDNWRVDLQDPTRTHYNVQVQRNDVPNPSSVAGVLVPITLATSLGTTGGSGGTATKARIEALRYAVHGALIQSAATMAQKLTDRGRVVIGGGNVLTMQIIAGQFNI
jgi:hypothetical protein